LIDKQQQYALLLLQLLRPVVSRRTTANDGRYLLGIFLACVTSSINQSVIFYLPEQKPDTLSLVKYKYGRLPEKL